VDRGIINLDGLQSLTGYRQFPKKGRIMPKKKRFYDVSRGQKDGDMIGSTAGFANMPQNLVMKLYPKEVSKLPVNLNDGMSGIDGQIGKDVSVAKKNLEPKKI